MLKHRWFGVAVLVASAVLAACGADDRGDSGTVAVPGGAPVAAAKAVVNRGVDADGNGRADILLANAAGRVLVWSMNGAQIEAQSEFSVGPEWRIIDASGDYNGDGRSDILWRNAEGTVAVWLMNGGTPIATAVLGTVPSDWVIADGRGDYDGDGRSDILWRNGAGTVAIWRMNGTAVLQTFFPATVPAEWSIIDGGGDYDGDGRSDVLWRNASGVIAIWRMNGGVIANATFLPGVGPEWTAVDGSGDYNGDGRSDVLWRNSNGQVVAWFMNDGVVSGTASLGAVDSQWRILDAASDFDGDGRSDILWQRSSGEITLWTIDGATRKAALSVGGVGPEWLVAAGSGATDGRARGAAPPGGGGGGGGGGGPGNGDATGGATDRTTSGYRDTLLTGRWEISEGDNPEPAVGECFEVPAFICGTAYSFRIADYGFQASGLEAVEFTRAEIYANGTCTSANRSIFDVSQSIRFKPNDTLITDLLRGGQIAVREGELLGDPAVNVVEDGFLPPANCEIGVPPAPEPEPEACSESISLRIEQVNGLPRLFKDGDIVCRPGSVPPPVRFITNWFVQEGARKR